jgi:hypothetical protein
VISRGAIHADGGGVTTGTAASIGGPGGAIQLQGLGVDSGVACTAAGGSGGQGRGGDGGRIWLTATAGTVDNHATGFDVGGGTGAVRTGAGGLFFLDGQVVPAP